MPSKTLLLAVTVIIFSSCTTAYKSGQTPDDVYYSPVRFIDEKQEDNRDRDDARRQDNDETEIRMRIRDRRWRDLDNNRDYSNSPYHYCTCSCTKYGYYYNPSFHKWPVYVPKATINSAPRIVNLNAYTGFNNNVPTDTKTNTSGFDWNNVSTPKKTSSSKSGSFLGKLISGVTSSKSESSSDKSRTYSPSSSSSSSSKSGSVSRPSRGN